FHLEGDLASVTLVGGFVTGSGHFAVTRTKASLDLNHDGTADVTDATLFELALTRFTVTIGDPNGIYLSATNASLALVIATAPAPVRPATDNRSWRAIKATLAGAGFHGLPADLTLT